MRRGNALICNNDLHDRVEREREAHTERDVLAENARIKSWFPHLELYPSRARLEAIIKEHTSDLCGKIVLDYGCGRGEESLAFLRRGAEKVHGIDISPVYIKYAAQCAREAGFPEHRHEFHVMDAHSLDFPGESFDLVSGCAILHHLDADIALREIYRVLKPGGRVLLYEPLADNPLLKLFRLLTPHARTKDEKAFSGKDIVRLLRQEDWDAELAYCGLLEAPVAMITSIVMRGNADNFLLHLADRVERWTHRHRMLLSWNQYVLFNMVRK
jgi:SAM-dependent methyltransferase